MSTNSNIRIQRTDGTTTGIYCHSDGYTEYNGVMLQLFYNTPEKLENLLKLGDISYLSETPADSCAYCRDRGEELRQTLQDEEFIYTFNCRDMVWYVEKYADDKTAGARFLALDYADTREKKLLIDDIIKKEKTVREVWDDPDIIEECKQAAKQARQKIIDEEAAQRAAYYEAYCY